MSTGSAQSPGKKELKHKANTKLFEFRNEERVSTSTSPYIFV
jgi:hypothetical protein